MKPANIARTWFTNHPQGFYIGHHWRQAALSHYACEALKTPRTLTRVSVKDFVFSTGSELSRGAILEAEVSAEDNLHLRVPGGLIIYTAVKPHP